MATTRLRDGEVTLYTRGDSKNYYAGFRKRGGGRLQESLKTRNKAEAKERALERHDDLKAREKYGLAEKTVAELLKEKSKGKKIVTTAAATEPARDNVVNLMDALRKSLPPSPQGPVNRTSQISTSRRPFPDSREQPPAATFGF